MQSGNVSFYFDKYSYFLNSTFWLFDVHIVKALYYLANKLLFKEPIWLLKHWHVVRIYFENIDFISLNSAIILHKSVYPSGIISVSFFTFNFFLPKWSPGSNQCSPILCIKDLRQHGGPGQASYVEPNSEAAGLTMNQETVASIWILQQHWHNAFSPRAPWLKAACYILK